MNSISGFFVGFFSLSGDYARGQGVFRHIFLFGEAHAIQDRRKHLFLILPRPPPTAPHQINQALRTPNPHPPTRFLTPPPPHTPPTAPQPPPPPPPPQLPPPPPLHAP